MPVLFHFNMHFSAPINDTFAPYLRGRCATHAYGLRLDWKWYGKDYS